MSFTPYQQSQLCRNNQDYETRLNFYKLTPIFIVHTERVHKVHPNANSSPSLLNENLSNLESPC